MEQNEKPLAPPDLTTGAQSTTESASDASASVSSNIPLFDAAGAVSPSEPTKGAAPIPDAPEKRGRGRPKGSGAGKPKTKPVEKLQAEAAVSIAAANASIVVGMLDLLRAGISGGECPANPDMRDAAQSAWTAYLAEQGVELPPWVQVAIVSTMYIAPAFSTPRGKGLISGAWAKLKGWYIAKRG